MRGKGGKGEMFELFRRGEILPDGRTNQDEQQLIKADTNSTNFTKPLTNANGR